MDETTFKLFESFDFENDQHFQEGWRCIDRLIDPEKRDSEYLRAQAFYFTKHVRNFDYEQYLVWRNRKQLEPVKSEATVGENNGKLNFPVCDAYPAKADESEEENGLSLAEVAELIQNNQPIPGVITVDVNPSNSDPTPSKMTRRLKPWELMKASVAVSESQQTATHEECSRAAV